MGAITITKGAQAAGALVPVRYVACRQTRGNSAEFDYFAIHTLVIVIIMKGRGDEEVMGGGYATFAFHKQKELFQKFPQVADKI